MSACSRLPRRTHETLAGIEIFRELAPDVVGTLSRRCMWHWYDAHQTIIQCQDESCDVSFVVSGRVCAIYHSLSGREVTICDLPAGEIFGDFAAIDGRPRSADVVAVSKTLVGSMTASMFWEILHEYEPVNAATLRRLTSIARKMLQRVVELSTLPVRSRIHAELLRLARVGAPGPGSGTAVIHPVPTHAEMASRISSHREAVTRELNELARLGLLEKKGGVLVIRDVGALAEMVCEVSDGMAWALSLPESTADRVR